MRATMFPLFHSYTLLMKMTVVLENSVPLLLCRGLSTVSAAWWACQTCFSIYQLVNGSNPIRSVESHGGGKDESWGWNAWLDARGHTQCLSSGSPGPRDLLANGTFERLAVAQVGLSFVWVRISPRLDCICTVHRC